MAQIYAETLLLTLLEVVSSPKTWVLAVVWTLANARSSDLDVG